MEAFWFCIVSVMLATYAILDGVDLGAGVIYLFLARTETERRTSLRAAGPFWDGNEVWLLMAGGALYFAFPAIYASRGFSLAATALLWILILRGIGMEFRNRVENPRAQKVLDIAYGVASILLALLLGAAAGFIIRGVPAWFPILCALFALAVVTLQSAAGIAVKSTGALQQRCRQLAAGAWWAVLLGYAGVTAASFAVEPHLLDNLLANSTGATSICAFAVIALAGLIGASLCQSIGFDLGVFASASCLIAGLLTSAAAVQFPNLPGYNLTVYNAGSTPHAASISAIWWIPAFVLALGYNVTMHRLFQSRAEGRTPSAILTAGD